MKPFVAVAAASVVAALVLSSAPAQARPIKSIDTFSSRMNGGTIASPHLHITVSVVGRYSFVRKYHGQQHTFYGFKISAQHCKPSGCWGLIKHGKLPVAYPRGKAVGSPKTASKLPCWIHACVNPVEWAKKGAKAVGGFSNWLGNTDEWLFKNITLPCVTGVGGGWVNTARTQISRRVVFLGGWMSKAKYVAGVEGPEGYAVAGVSGCALTLGAYGVLKATTVAHKLGIQ